MILTIINSIGIFGLITFLIGKHLSRKYSLEIERTTWEKKPYGFHITKWKYDVGATPNSGVGVFHFHWRNGYKLTDDIKKSKP